MFLVSIIFIFVVSGFANAGIVGFNGLEKISGLSERSQFRVLGKSVVLVTTTWGIGNNQDSSSHTKSTCSGFRVSVDIFVTADHCVKDISSSKSNIRNPIRIELEIFDSSKQKKLVAVVDSFTKTGAVFLKLVEKVTENYSELLLANRYPKVGERLFILQYPLGGPLAVSRHQCIVTEINQKEHTFNHNCDTLPGSSGGPVFALRDNTVVGFNYGIRSFSENYAISIFPSNLFLDNSSLPYTASFATASSLDKDYDIVSQNISEILHKPGLFGSLNLDQGSLFESKDPSVSLVENISHLSDSSPYKKYESVVGRLDVLLTDTITGNQHLLTCSAWLFTKKYVLTSFNCLENYDSNLKVKRIGLHLFSKKDEKIFLNLSKKAVESNTLLDFVILEIPENEKVPDWVKPINLKMRDITIDEEIAVIHYSKHNELQITRAFCFTRKNNTAIDGVYNHSCDSTLSSRGGLIVSTDTSEILGILTKEYIAFSKNTNEESRSRIRKKNQGQFSAITYIAEHSDTLGTEVRSKTTIRSKLKNPFRAAKWFNGDVSKIVSIADNEPVKIWDSLTGTYQLISKTAFLHDVITFDIRKNLLAIGTSNGLVELWDIATDDRIEKKIHKSYISSLAFSPDGSLLASSSVDGRVFLWDVSQYTKDENNQETLQDDKQMFEDFYLPEGVPVFKTKQSCAEMLNSLVSGYSCSTIFKKMEPNIYELENHDDWIWDVDFYDSHGNSNIDQTELVKSCTVVSVAADGGEDGLLKKWTWDERLRPDGGVMVPKPRSSCPPNVHPSIVSLRDSVATAVEVHPDGKELAIGDKKGNITFFDKSTLEANGSHTVHKKSVTDLEWSKDGLFLFSTSADESISAWSFELNEVLERWDHEDIVWSVGVDNSQNAIVTSSHDGTIKTWPIGVLFDRRRELKLLKK